MVSEPLVDAFLAARALRGAQGAGDREALATRLAAAIAEGRRTHPGLAVPDGAFSKFLGERLGAEELEGAPFADLFLACACLRGEPGAAEAFETVSRPSIEGALRRLELPADRIDDVRGRLRARLLVGEEGREALLSRYGGTGALASWLRVVATREGLALLRRANDDVEADERLPALEDDAELAFLKQSYRAAFREAFAEAMTALSPRDRTLLKQHHLDGLSAREIGRLRRVHHATAARWLEAARDAVLARTRQSLMSRLKMERDEFESVIRLLQSRWEVTVRRFLDPSSGTTGGT